MLENKIRTPEELKKYILDLKKWLAQERDKPIEEMADFFSNRIDNYDNVHLNNWARKENHIPDDVFVHIDIPLTLEHQIQLMKNAGFKNVHILYENKSTMIIKAEK